MIFDSRGLLHRFTKFFLYLLGLVVANLWLNFAFDWWGIERDICNLFFVIGPRSFLVPLLFLSCRRSTRSREFQQQPKAQQRKRRRAWPGNLREERGGEASGEAQQQQRQAAAAAAAFERCNCQR